jgi:hypothetical protein
MAAWLANLLAVSIRIFPVETFGQSVTQVRLQTPGLAFLMNIYELNLFINIYQM